MNQTKIIAFEGIDGTGKSVQMEALRGKLEQRGWKVGVLSFPDYGSFFGGCVGRYLTKKGYRDYVGDEKDEYEKQDSIQLRARSKYLSFGERLSNVQVIPCMEGGALLPIEAIAQRVYAAAEGIL